MRQQRQVSACWLIGSVLDSDRNFDDVDLLLVLNDWNVRRWLTRKKITFHLVFGRRLDVQVFHKTQNQEIRQFLRWAKRFSKV